MITTILITYAIFTLTIASNVLRSNSREQDDKRFAALKRHKAQP